MKWKQIVEKNIFTGVILFLLHLKMLTADDKNFFFLSIIWNKG